MFFFRKMSKSFAVAVFGIRHASSERNVRIHLFVAIAVMLLGLYVNLAIWEWCVIWLAMGMVLGAELLNTAIEELSDVVRDQNKLDRMATKLPRDISAGAVLLVSFSSAVVGLLIFIPKLFA